MSWKNLASVAVCALLASPALAAPTLQVVNGGLDGSGNWIWNVSVTPDTALFSLNVENDPVNEGGSIAVELGFTASDSNLVSAATNPVVPVLGGNVESFNPGNGIFGWETEEDTDPDPVIVNMRPVGLQQGTEPGDTNELFAALGSTYFISGGAKHILTITTEGPASGRLTTTLDVQGLLAQDDPASTNDTFAIAANTSFSRTALLGDVNLDGTVNPTDLTILGGNWLQSPRFWNQGNLNGDADDIVNSTDLTILGGNWLATEGAGAGSATAVPEPSIIALIGVGLVALLATCRRQR